MAVERAGEPLRGRARGRRVERLERLDEPPAGGEVGRDDGELALGATDEPAFAHRAGGLAARIADEDGAGVVIEGLGLG